jgi:restriction system protein
MIQGMSAEPIPPYHEMMLATLIAVSDSGGSASISEIVDRAVKYEGYSDEQQAVLHGDGPNTEIEYRLAWARTYLKGMGLLTNSKRAVWSLTSAGHDLVAVGRANADRGRRLLRDMTSSYVAERCRSRRAKRQDVDDEQISLTTNTEDSRDWREQLLDALMAMSPDGFERLAQRLLREAGFISATVTGRSGDGGIDGLGVYRLSLVSFPVFYQCKRYKGSAGAAAVRDFRGAMAGRGDKGLLITTGTFTADAKAEATRDGAPPVDLIDGERLCDLLREYDLGVTTTIRQVEDISVDPSFFAGI